MMYAVKTHLPQGEWVALDCNGNPQLRSVKLTLDCLLNKEQLSKALRWNCLDNVQVHKFTQW